MKKIILILLFGPFIIKGAKGQGLQPADIFGMPGYSYMMVYSGTSGFNSESLNSAIWDFSGAEPNENTQKVFKVIEPAQSPYLNDFPGTNHVVLSFPYNDSANLSYTHYNLTDTFYEAGQRSGFSVTYTNPAISLVFPVNVSDSLSDDYAYESEAFGTSYYYNGNATVTVLRTGKLMLPGITVDNAILIRKQTKQLRQTFNDSSFTTAYCWYSKGVKHPLAILTYYRHSSNPDISSIFLHTTSLNTSIGAIEANKESGLSVYPSLFVDHVNIEGGFAHGQLTDITGRSFRTAIKPSYNSGKTILSLEELPAGLYYLHLTDQKGEMRTFKLVKAGL